ncbi:DUF2511 domain-containing protein [Amycolatopsis sp. NPDC059021]|uniref:DUF2511 domain-containing protein n=1 Tax=Amycolatopsis sp. NPDC059021 TaxID=3346704 RepID=UPI00366DD94A
MNAQLRWIAGTAVALGLALTAACGGSGANNPPNSAPVPLPKPTSNRQEVSRQNLAYMWPLTVDHGTMECRPGPQAVFVAPDGKAYALNDKAAEAGIASIEPLRATGADNDKISLGSLIGKTLSLCKAGK